MKLVCISDTHEQEDRVTLPQGDVLIHAGDSTYRGLMPAITKFIDWMKVQPFQHKVLISGNHDWCFQNKNHNRVVDMCKEAGLIYLQDSGAEIDGVKFWGSPWQPWFYDWAFNLRRGKAIAAKWALIPNDTHVLITHGPVMNILDEAPRGVFDFEHVGCQDLANRIATLPDLKVHICGHIHNSYGQVKIGNVQYVNASTCTEQYAPINNPIVIEV